MVALMSDLWWWSNDVLFNLDVTCEISSDFHSLSLISAVFACKSCVLFSVMFWWVLARLVWFTNFDAAVTNGCWDCCCCCTSIWLAFGDVVCWPTDWFIVGSWAGIGIGAFGVAKPGILWACGWWSCCWIKSNQIEMLVEMEKIRWKPFIFLIEQYKTSRTFWKSSQNMMSRFICSMVVFDCSILVNPIIFDGRAMCGGKTKHREPRNDKVFTGCAVGGTTFENEDCGLWINGNDWLVKLAATPVGFASTTEPPTDFVSMPPGDFQ